MRPCSVKAVSNAAIETTPLIRQGLTEALSPAIASKVISHLEHDQEEPERQHPVLKVERIDTIPSKVENLNLPGLQIRSSKIGAPEEKPLFILNGKVLESEKDHLKNVKPEDIESINVIKGEQATILFGEKGQHGVVEILTKGWVEQPEPAEEIKWENGIDVGEDFSSSKFFCGPEGKAKVVDPLIVIDGSPLGRKSEVENQIDQSTIGFYRFSAPTDQLMALYGAAASEGVVTMTSKEVEGAEQKEKAEDNSLSISPAELFRQQLADELQIFPNPFQDQIQINYLVKEEIITSLSVFDKNGRLVKALQAPANRVGSQSVTWDASNAPAGTYTIVLQAGDARVSKSVVKQ